MPKRYLKEFRDRAVRLVLDHEKDYSSRTQAVLKVSEQVGVSHESVRRWVAQHEVDVGAKQGTTTQEREEVKRLKAENRQLREANEILKAASVFFAGELDPRRRWSAGS